MKKLDIATLQQLRNQLEELPPRQTLRPYDVIAQLAETLTDAQARGYDIDDLVAVLNAAGITLARNTVRNYLSRALTARRAPAPAAAPHPTPTVSTNTAPSQLPRPTQVTGLKSTAGQDSREGSAAAAPSPATPGALARARERAQQRHNSNNTPNSTGRTAGSFSIVPDTEEL